MTRKETYFAAVGDVHGSHQRMVDLVTRWQSSSGVDLDFILQVGDFEPHRHDGDVATMSAPAKYKTLGDFHLFHREQRRFPWPIYFIGGNHEPHGFLEPLADGGEVAPNCRYLGRAGSVTLGHGLRIAGLSGIYQERTWPEGRPSIDKIGHRSLKDFIGFGAKDVDSVLDHDPVDVLLLHDWPHGLVCPQDYEQFRGQYRVVEPEDIGNEPARELVDLLKPKLVLCGHMHRRYRATLHHSSGDETSVACLASVHQGWPSLAVFKVSGDRIEELPDTAGP
ncbi:Metallophosphoesterase [Sulfidibacter corallicola]|uniref:Metallophosphoesterase n=1 Tax=Sulfidibacter corallicola TaxID=2818388 RepID=A0A8A4TN63_SULCO|nr:metallophosphoesterase [Sulfidibacter corallicola]QTD50644.1 metallophosphoesterase [Sulfidibacter corallicola]